MVNIFSTHGHIRNTGGGMTQQDSDLQLVRRVQKGDKRAFDLLVIKHQHKVLSLISRYVSDMSEAQDIAQESFIKAYKGLKTFRGDSQFYTWLFRIAVNTAKNYLLTKGRRPPAQDLDVNDGEHLAASGALKDVASPDKILARDELKKVIFATIETLPDELRTALTLREFDGMSYEDISDVMQCPIGTVRSRIFRAREVVDKAMQPLLEKTQQTTLKDNHAQVASTKF